MSGSKFERSTINQDSVYEDLVIADSRAEKIKNRKKSTGVVVYCTSYACNTPVKSIHQNGTSNLKQRVIENPPTDGWCPYCHNALFYEEQFRKD